MGGLLSHVGLLLAAISGGGGGISCAVPLDDPGTLADMFSLSLLPMDAPGKQTFTFANQADGAEYIALPAGALVAANFPRPATNPMAAQYKITAATLPASSAANYGALMVVVLSAEGAPLGQAYVRMFGYSAAAVALGSGGYGELYVNDNPVAQSEFATSIEGKSTAFYVNPDGTIGYTVAGVNRGTVPGLTVGATDKVLFALRHKDATGGGGAGVTFSGAFLSSAGRT